jgi:uncharacterized RDD family membrane protein YckC
MIPVNIRTEHQAHLKAHEIEQPSNTPASYMTDSINTELRYAGIFRRLFAIFYDCFLLTAILFIVSAVGTALNHGRAIEPGAPLYPLFVSVIFALSYLYFAWFWIHGGQTLGMKTWRMQIQTCDISVINWKTAGIRFITAILSWAIFGLGFFWAFFDRKHRCWHDLTSNTVLIDLRTRK